MLCVLGVRIDLIVLMYLVRMMLLLMDILIGVFLCVISFSVFVFVEYVRLNDDVLNLME